MMKYLVAIVLIAAALGAGYYYGFAGGTATDTEPEARMTNSNVEREQAAQSSWTFAEAGEKDGIPQTQVSFAVDAKVTVVGTFEGHCADMKGSAWTMRDGATAGAVCWFAGGGTEIGAFHENGKYVIKTAVLDEGTAETAGVRGELVTLLSI
jgi:hypothetical protein